MSARDDHARRVRALRGGLAASSATFVALASHLAGGGQMPGLLGIVVPLALSLPVSMAWAGRRLSLLGLSASVVASQLFFHVLFMLGTPVRPAQASSGSGAHAGHQGMVVPTSAETAGQTTEMAHTDATMWVWHAVAAVVTIVVLYRGELMLLRLRDLAVRTAAWLLRGRAVVEDAGSFVRPALPSVVAATFRPLHPDPQLSPLRRRGPPVPHAV
ncbi:hypothetical protein [Promicromonospora panici]|uniref:hypothetical protein n=1 Tax=Promicromonospora panici TaxID=2219658 RepID=UPI00101CF5A0|nr:hypothetical protein [Promicromonospora panici]